MKLGADDILADIERHPPVMDPWVREGIAVAAHADANLPLWFPSGEVLAEALGYVISKSRWAGDDQARLFERMLVLSSRASANDNSFAAHHEVAHDRVKRHHHTHGDVWLLALALAMPGDRLHMIGTLRPAVPSWAIALRLRFWEELARAA